MAFFLAPLAAGAAAGAGQGIGQAIGGLLNAHPKDKIRFARNADMAQRAANGDINSFYHLGVMSGRVVAPVTYTYGPLNDGWTGTVKKGTSGGWATGKTKDDAWAKYQQVAARFGVNPSQGSGVTNQTIPNTNNIGNGGIYTGNSDNGTGVVPGIFTAGAIGGVSPLTYIIGGGIAYLLYLAVSGKGR